MDMDFDSIYGQGGFFTKPDNWDKSIDMEGNVTIRTIQDLRDETDQMVNGVMWDDLDKMDKPDMLDFVSIWTQIRTCPTLVDRADIRVMQAKLVYWYNKYEW